MPSDLPIISPEPSTPRRSQAERYGTLYYLGIAGLITVVTLVAWFGLGLWSLRGYFAEVYTLHDPRRSEVDRVNSALALSRADQAGQRQYWDDALDRRLPDLARYLMAESLSVESTSADPRGYALSAARSEGWPDWLRILVVRPMALAASEPSSGRRFPDEALIELRKRPDPILGLWTRYIQAVGGDKSARDELARTLALGDPSSGLASLLLDALDAQGNARRQALDRATTWLRSHHPGASQVWRDWEFSGEKLQRRSP